MFAERRESSVDNITIDHFGSTKEHIYFLEALLSFQVAVIARACLEAERWPLDRTRCQGGLRSHQLVESLANALGP